ncbi:MAG TPA: hypothetical protein PLU87_18025 [Sedimentisphaerales bacterium]|nr:hypothetical protein [Sedimentisphaerales bacterium]HRS12911.1 hypothetical protein [Sedimentisphaerales bacterium]HRV49523.1 hypothetical protein [Sedimentisphaerales bacterium]
MRYGSIGAFTFNLTREQRQVCTWVAEQAAKGITRIAYDDLRAALKIWDDREITRILREIRERLDEVHEMVQFPIVNTARPYFEIHPNADYIWDDYCRAEHEAEGLLFENASGSLQASDCLVYGCAACTV